MDIKRAMHIYTDINEEILTVTLFGKRFAAIIGGKGIRISKIYNVI
ncbi:hypothetical protein [Calorimonas adulescens]|nr:hypothetical protein [Calorimonas adulescens]